MVPSLIMLQPLGILILIAWFGHGRHPDNRKVTQVTLHLMLSTIYQASMSLQKEDGITEKQSPENRKGTKGEKAPEREKELSKRERATQDKTTAQAIWWIQLCCGQIEEARSIPAKCKGGSSGKESKKQNGNFNGICHEEEAGGSRVPLTFYQRYFF